jgi:hypothetical protein
MDWNFGEMAFISLQFFSLELLVYFSLFAGSPGQIHTQQNSVQD